MTLAKPLPERLRPDSLEGFVGQTHLSERLGILMSTPRLPSLLLFGPPGCGKSTLALLLANAHSRSVLRLSAPEAGLQQLRRQLSGVEVLVLDELHRFSKAQQDFFLPLLETGELTMIATTTENPSFSVTRQLLSRLHVLRLRQLGREELLILARRGAEQAGLFAAQDAASAQKAPCSLFDSASDTPEGTAPADEASPDTPADASPGTPTDAPLPGIADDVLDFLASAAHGDARTLLNLVEHAASLPPDRRDLAAIKATLPDILARHDKDGDSHYEYASALIKSIRGSDPNAALYYLACLLEGGEDPRFICRRLILSASEDVGLADPRALPLAVACQQAVEFVGMPEGYIPLAETVVYLALAPKSNSSYAAYANAKREVRLNGPAAVPLHLRNASTKLQKEWGYGKDYRYPHNFPNAWVEQEYMPPNVAVPNFYQPKGNGEEPRLNAWHQRIVRKR